MRVLGFSVLFLFTLGCTQVASDEASVLNIREYPAHWWAELPQVEKKKWEVSPASVKAPQVILSKRNELGILSNFAATPFVYKNKKYASVEGFWQAMKYPETNFDDPRHKLAKWPHTRKEVEGMVGFEAKRAGSFASKVMKKHKISWVSFMGEQMQYRHPGKGAFYKQIVAAMKEKLAQNTEASRVLQSTEGLILKPDHSQGKNPPPAWRYHEIYMEFRDKVHQ